MESVKLIFVNILVYLYMLLKIRNIGFKTFDYMKAYSTITQNNLFDSNEYMEKYNIDFFLPPLLHYLFHGWKEGKTTKPTKMVEKKLKNNKKFIKSNLNPLVYAVIYTNNKFMIPNYKSLNKTLKGKNNFLFLINDFNNEIKQHFDDFFISEFDIVNFKDYFQKK